MPSADRGMHAFPSLLRVAVGAPAGLSLLRGLEPRVKASPGGSYVRSSRRAESWGAGGGCLDHWDVTGGRKVPAPRERALSLHSTSSKFSARLSPRNKRRQAPQECAWRATFSAAPRQLCLSPTPTSTPMQAADPSKVAQGNLWNAASCGSV